MRIDNPDQLFNVEIPSDKLYAMIRILSLHVESLMKDNQVILQYLVKSEKLSVDEIDRFRKYVSNNSNKLKEFKKIFDDFDKKLENESQELELLRKVLNNPSTATDEERRAVLSMLDN